MKSTQSKKVLALLKESCLPETQIVVVMATSKKTGQYFFQHKTLKEWFEFSVANTNNKDYNYCAMSETFAQNNQLYAHWKKNQKST